MIHSLTINDFRLFKNCEIKLAKHITAISGKNAVGKSTLLAILGNSCELKGYKTIFNTNFRTEFSEIFKADEKFDLSGSDKCVVNFSEYPNINEIKSNKICRVTWQSKKAGKRFRLIPETKTAKLKNSRKESFPSLYLGLSRLYPIGEVDDENLNKNKVNLTKDEVEEFMSNYKHILNVDVETYKELDSFKLQESKRKCGIGITTSEYSSLTNSAGQDNIGQIILSILSFKRLKNNLGEEYKGGLLLIDEIEATLHPSAQIKLLNYIYNQSKILKLQIIFTTHSTCLLEYMSNYITSNSSSEQINDYEIVYITRNNGPLMIIQNPNFYIIENDLKIMPPGTMKKITVYSEDAEARWLFRKIIDQYEIYVNLVETKVGCSSLLNICRADPSYFSNVIFLLDGDVCDQTINDNNIYNNIIKLPGSVRPEQVIYEYLLNIDPYSKFWNNAMRMSITKESLKEYGPYSTKYKGRERDRFKQWFNDIRIPLEQLDLIQYWKEDNPNLYTDFIQKFIQTYNTISKRSSGNIIQ